MSEQPHENDGSSPANVLRCGSSLYIANVAELRERMLEVCASARPILLDASDPDRIDTAGVQLLAAFVRYCRDQDIPFEWQEVPPSLREAAARLGLAERLDLPPVQPAASAT